MDQGILEELTKFRFKGISLDKIREWSNHSIENSNKTYRIDGFSDRVITERVDDYSDILELNSLGKNVLVTDLYNGGNFEKGWNRFLDEILKIEDVNIWLSLSEFKWRDSIKKELYYQDKSKYDYKIWNVSQQEVESLFHGRRNQIELKFDGKLKFKDLPHKRVDVHDRMVYSNY